MMMESYSGIGKEDDQMILPPGFRFHPTDEELITHYLIKKVLDNNFSAKAIGEVDMNRVEPWQLPGLSKMGEKEWYFFSMKDKKYPTGQRTNRATDSGYWKATGKDKEIFRGKSLIGMKKTLVFYKGRAPKGEKTNWVIHEFRLEGRSSVQPVTKSTKNEWVICRVFHKNSGEKKPNSGGNGLPPLTESSTSSDSVHVPCFSNQINIQQPPNNTLTNPIYPFAHNSGGNYSFPASQSAPAVQFQFPARYTFPVPNQDYFINDFRMGNGMDTRTRSQETALSSEMNTEISSVMPDFETGKRVFDDEQAPSTSVAPIDMDCIWDY